LGNIWVTEYLAWAVNARNHPEVDYAIKPWNATIYRNICTCSETYGNGSNLASDQKVKGSNPFGRTSQQCPPIPGGHCLFYCHSFGWGYFKKPAIIVILMLHMMVHEISSFSGG